MHKVSYLDSVAEDLRALDPPARARVLNKIEKHLARNPKGLGQPLKGDFEGFWRYRVGDFRVIYRVADKEILIVVARIGHRKDVYR